MQKRIRQAVVLAVWCMPLCAAEAEPSPVVLDDPTERILLCTPQGPVIVQMSITIGGRPYRHHIERIIDEQMAANPSWPAAFESRAVLTGNFLRSEITQTRADFVARHDRNADGLISRGEMRSVLLEAAAGDTIGLFYGAREINHDEMLMELIDADGDWRLSADELSQAVSRVARVDFSRNDAVQTAEMARAVSRRRARMSTLGVMLGRPDSPEAAARQLREHYANSEGVIARSAFQLVPVLFERLDANRDEQLQESELPRIAGLPAQITLRLRDLDAGAHKPVRFESVRTSAEVVLSEQWKRTSSNLICWDSGEGELEFYTEWLSPTGRTAGKAAMLGTADLEEKVRRIESMTAPVRKFAVSRSWVSIALLRHPPALWRQLDTNGDDELGARELQNLSRLLAEYDVDGDGEVAYFELPTLFEVVIDRGRPNIARLSRSMSPQRVRARDPGPVWFNRMDQNDDGDISPREFLGTEKQFRLIDADDDGLIDPREAYLVTP